MIIKTVKVLEQYQVANISSRGLQRPLCYKAEAEFGSWPFEEKHSYVKVRQHTVSHSTLWQERGDKISCVSV